MNLIVTQTSENTRSYPQHSHDVAEITCYLEGEGVLKTERGDIPFSKGTIILIPAGVRHGSVSHAPFKNVSVHSDELSNRIQEFLVGKDNEAGDVQRFSELLFRLSFCGEEKRVLKQSVLIAYRELVFDLIVKSEGDFLAAFKNQLVQSVGGGEFNFAEAVRASGYAEDYLRVLFKNRYGVTPHAYLTALRMEYAKTLIKTYGDKRKICEIAWNCGYSDPLYFSKLFKKTYGCSPRAYIEKTVQ